MLYAAHHGAGAYSCLRVWEGARHGLKPRAGNMFSQHCCGPRPPKLYYKAWPQVGAGVEGAKTSGQGTLVKRVSKKKNENNKKYLLLKLSLKLKNSTAHEKKSHAVSVQTLQLGT